MQSLGLDIQQENNMEAVPCRIDVDEVIAYWTIWDEDPTKVQDHIDGEQQAAFIPITHIYCRNSHLEMDLYNVTSEKIDELKGISDPQEATRDNALGGDI